MENNGQNKEVAISTIPIGKLAVVMNNFICNTINHLNKLSVKGDEKLAEFDKKLNDLEIMTTLLESKLNSLPENITSTYPPIEEVNLDDVNPRIINNPDPILPSVDSGSEPVNPDESSQKPTSGDLNVIPEQKDEDNFEGQKQGEEGQELSPEAELDKFLDEHDEEYQKLSKTLKLGVPVQAVKQKARINGMDMDEFQQFIEILHKVDPKIRTDAGF